MTMVQSTLRVAGRATPWSSATPRVPHALTAETVVSLSRAARRLLGLLPLVAVEENPGRFCADPDFLAAALFPYDELATVEAVATWIDELLHARVIRVGVASDGTYGVLVARAR